MFEAVDEVAQARVGAFVGEGRGSPRARRPG